MGLVSIGCAAPAKAGDDPLETGPGTAGHQRTDLAARVELATGQVWSVQNMGLATGSPVPPLGDAIVPLSGSGGDGAFTVTRIGGWTNGAGAVQGHGGQWVMPNFSQAGETLLNVSCDVVPRPDAIDFWEVVGAGGSAIGSFTVPATTAQVIIRGWVILNSSSSTPPSPGYQLGDGEQVVIRHSFMDSVSGAWTPAGHDMTVISCAVNAAAPRATHVTKLSPLGHASVGGVFQVDSAGFTGNWFPVNDGDALGLELPVRAGDRIDSINASVYGSTTYTVTASVKAQDDAFHVGARLGSEKTSAAQNSLQMLTIVPLANDNSGNNETVTTSQRSYYLQFLARRLGNGGGNLAVGPITLVTSSTTP